MIDKMYTSIKGKGAMLNGETVLKVSGVKDMSKAMMIMELPVGANHSILPKFNPFLPTFLPVRGGKFFNSVLPSYRAKLLCQTVLPIGKSCK